MSEEVKEMMYGAVLHGINDLRYEKVPVPEPGDHDLLVKVKAAAICGSDVPRVKTRGTYHFPTIPCHEFSGVVVKKGKAVLNFEMGEPVVVYPLISCRECTPCRQGKPNLCDEYDYLGSRSDGAFAEYVRCPARNAFKVPETISFDDASLVEPLAVGLRGVKRGEISPGQKVIVFGTGTMGLSVVQWAKVFGASVIAVDRNQHKLDLAVKSGADQVIDSSVKSLRQSLRLAAGKNGADAVIECSGAPLFRELAITFVKKKGIISLVGNPQGNVFFPESLFQEISRKELTIRGTWNSLITEEENEWQATIEQLARGNLKPSLIITHRFNLKDARQVFDELHHRKVEGYCKGIFVFD